MSPEAHPVQAVPNLIATADTVPVALTAPDPLNIPDPLARIVATQLTEIVNPLSNADRGVIDAISRGTLPDAGMSFEIPKITAVPTVDQINENQAIADTQLTASYITVSVKPFKGRSITTVELIERSSPTFFDELVRQMEFAYAKDTDSFVATAIQGAGTLNANAKANSATGLLEYIASGAAAVYTASLGFARNLLVTPDQWANIMSYNDNGRPIYNAVAPQNAGGTVSATSLVGNVAGLNLYVDAYKTGSGDNSMFIVNPDANTWYESPRATLRANVIATGQVSVLYYGFGALAVKTGAGCNRFNFT